MLCTSACRTGHSVHDTVHQIMTVFDAVVPTHIFTLLFQCTSSLYVPSDEALIGELKYAAHHSII